MIVSNLMTPSKYIDTVLLMPKIARQDNYMYKIADIQVLGISNLEIRTTDLLYPRRKL